MEYHPDKIQRSTQRVLNEAREIWKTVFKNGKDEDFKTTYNIFEWKLKPRIKESIDRVSPIFAELSQAECLENQDILDCTTWMQAPYWVATEVILKELGYASFSRLLTDKRYQHVVESECDFHHKTQLEMNTPRVLRYLLSAYMHFGRKLYTVSPGLAFTLQHTELKKMPAELLTLPYPCIYLVMPPNTFSIYNIETGIHPVEGAYIVEDTDVTPRSWKIMLTGLANENSINSSDDALYHYNIVLEDGKSLEECIEMTVRFATEGLSVRGTVAGQEIVTGDMPEEELEIFHKSKAQLIQVFKYAACVCLYATHPDAEVEVFNESPEYRSLYNRAMKAKGDKRKKLFKRANESKGDTRLLLGGSVTVSREDRAAALAPRNKGAGTKHKVRTYVQAHWQHYRVKADEGGYGRKYLLKKAYWKGAAHLPTTEKKHHVK